MKNKENSDNTANVDKKPQQNAKRRYAPKRRTAPQNTQIKTGPEKSQSGNTSSTGALKSQTAQKNAHGAKTNTSYKNKRAQQNRGAHQQSSAATHKNKGSNNAKNTQSPAVLSLANKNTRVSSAGKRAKQNTKIDPNAPKLHIYPLGGLGEVGKNITLFECNGDMIIVDCGLVFPDSDMFGVDLVIPDFSFVLENKDRIRGIIITHGHEDHIGSLPYLLKQVNLPIFATGLTIGLLGNKLEEHGLKKSTKCTRIHPKKKFKLGCFTIEPIHVNHSIPDAVAYAIDSPAGVVLHTGDFKIDYTPLTGGPTDLATIAKYGNSGVLALISDSTNSERPGFTLTEQKVGEAFATLFNKAEKQRIIIASFASNLYRIQQIMDMAVANGRKIAVSGRSMINNTQMALELGYLHAPETSIISVDDIGKYPPEKIVLITTGSQGEALSALSRMSISSHRSVQVGEGDFIIISANPIPGNEKMVTKVINGLLKLGAEVIYESMYEVHVSGHACQEEQKLVLALAKPKFFLPAHGEYKQLKKHAKTAIDVGVPKENVYIGENGDHIVLSKNGIEVKDSVTAGIVLVDGLGVGDVGSIVLRDRRHLSEDGLVIVTLAIDKVAGQIISGPEIISRGFVYVKENESLIEDACTAVRNLLLRIDSPELRDSNSLKARMRETVSSYLYRRTKRSPMILPVIIEV